MKSKTPLYNTHARLDAHFIEFFDFLMPLKYSSVKEEHLAVRENAGMFDVSHMGEFVIEGPGAYDFVQKVTCNDVAEIDKPGKIQYTGLLNENGGYIDDLLVYHLAENKYMMVVNCSNREKDFSWLEQHKPENVTLKNHTSSIALLAVQGPKAEEILQMLTDKDLAAISFYTFEYGSIAGAEDVILSATGYTGSGGFELYTKAEDAVKVWEAIMEAGKRYGLKPAGLGARDTLRLETGLRLHGNDITETTTPIEANLSWMVKFTEGNNFIGREVVEKQKQEGVTRKLRPFLMLEKGVPREDYPIVNGAEEEIGVVTSGAMSPMRNEGIGFGYIKKGYTKRDTEIYVKMRGRKRKAVITKLPFVKLK